MIFQNFLSLFSGILQNNGPIIIYLLIFLLFATIFINFKNSKKILVTSENLKKEIINLNYIFLASALPLPILLYFTTHQITYRKISPAVVLLLIYLLVIIFRIKILRKLLIFH